MTNSDEPLFIGLPDLPAAPPFPKPAPSAVTKPPPAPKRKQRSSSAFAPSPPVPNVERPVRRRSLVMPAGDKYRRQPRILAVQLTEMEMAGLTEASRRMGVSRSELVRLCLSAVISPPVEVSLVLPALLAERLMLFRNLAGLGEEVRKVAEASGSPFAGEDLSEIR